MKSPRTTIVGVLAILIAAATFLRALIDGDPETVPNFEMLIAALVGTGLVAARDQKQHDKDKENKET